MRRPLLIIKPATDPVSLAYFQAHVRIASGDDDSDAGAKLAAATNAVGLRCGRDQLLESTWEHRMECFPDENYFELPIAQVQSIASITYMDSSGTTWTMPAADYHLAGGYSPVEPDADPHDVNGQVTFGARVYLKYARVWPNATLETGEPISVRFVAGWKSPENVPEDLRLAICLEAAHLYRNRESVTVGNSAVESKPLSRGVEDLIVNYRKGFYG